MLENTKVRGRPLGGKNLYWASIKQLNQKFKPSAKVPLGAKFAKSLGIEDEGEAIVNITKIENDRAGMAVAHTPLINKSESIITPK